MFDPDQLAALAAVLRTGAFDRAAAQLGVTPSAVSQRIRALEEAAGAVLVIRGTPCTGTPLGQRLAAHAEEVRRLSLALAAEIGRAGDAPPPVVRLAVNADSLATWLLPALAEVPGTAFDIVVDDQDVSDDWLRRAEVAAAITGRARAVQSCEVWPLGSLRYLATASPAFVARHFSGGVTPDALARAPCLTFNAKDRLQDRWLARMGAARATPPRHWLPSSEGFVTGALLGLGWGMNPVALAGPHLASGRLVALDPAPLDVPLHWQVQRRMKPALAPLTRAVRAAAARALVPA